MTSSSGSSSLSDDAISSATSFDETSKSCISSSSKAAVGSTRQSNVTACLCSCFSSHNLCFRRARSHVIVPLLNRRTRYARLCVGTSSSEEIKPVRDDHQSTWHYFEKPTGISYEGQHQLFNLRNESSLLAFQGLEECYHLLDKLNFLLLQAVKVVPLIKQHSSYLEEMLWLFK